PITSPLPRRRTFLALALTMVCPIETCPSPPITTLPPLRTVRMVVPCQGSKDVGCMRGSGACNDVSLVRQGRNCGCRESGEGSRALIKGARLNAKDPFMRKGSVRRSTKETDVEVAIALGGTGVAATAPGIGSLDHRLELLARHSRIDLTVKAKGDLHIDHHHTTEDVGIALGQAVKQALGDMKGITRYADVHVPMDEALTRVALDISGRPFLVFKAEFVRDKVGSF